MSLEYIESAITELQESCYEYGDKWTTLEMIRIKCQEAEALHVEKTGHTLF